jgi:hypothetical protein
VFDAEEGILGERQRTSQIEKTHRIDNLQRTKKLLEFGSDGFSAWGFPFDSGKASIQKSQPP